MDKANIEISRLSPLLGPLKQEDSKWMELKLIMLSEDSQRERGIFKRISFICEI